MSGHALNPAIIFSSLQFFNIIRAPLVFFPLVLSNVSDALVALGRIGDFLTADELEDPYEVDDSAENKWALRVDGSFTWETVGKPVAGKFGHPGPAGKLAGAGGKPGHEKKQKRAKGRKSEPILPTTAPSVGPSTTEDKNKDEKPFALENMSLRIPKGSFIAIVGRVGSGKSSLLQALVGEMRMTKGDVVFGGSVAYVPQQPWIVNATLKDNVLFGKEDDDTKSVFYI